MSYRFENGQRYIGPKEDWLRKNWPQILGLIGFIIFSCVAGNRVHHYKFSRLLPGYGDIYVRTTSGEYLSNVLVDEKPFPGGKIIQIPGGGEHNIEFDLVETPAK